MLMETMKNFVEQIKKRYDVKFGSEMAHLLGITPQAWHQYKTGRSKHFSEPVAYRVAELLNLNPAYVLLCLRVESADNRATRSVWLAMLNKVERYAATAVFLAVLLPYFVFKLPMT